MMLISHLRIAVVLFDLEGKFRGFEHRKEQLREELRNTRVESKGTHHEQGLIVTTAQDPF